MSSDLLYSGSILSTCANVAAVAATAFVVVLAVCLIVGCVLAVFDR